MEWATSNTILAYQQSCLNLIYYPKQELNGQIYKIIFVLFTLWL